MLRKCASKGSICRPPSCGFVKIIGQATDLVKYVVNSPGQVYSEFVVRDQEHSSVSMGGAIQLSESLRFGKGPNNKVQRAGASPLDDR